MDVILLAEKLCGKDEPVSQVRRAARNWSGGRRDRGADGKTKVQIHTNQTIQNPVWSWSCLFLAQMLSEGHPSREREQAQKH